MEFYLYGHKTKKRYQLLDLIHPNPGVQLTSPRNQHRSSCNFSEDFTTIFDFENTRYCALPSREERLSIDPLCGRVKCSY
ncbi:hypothetical protein Anas_13982 [Armadillidium nasatum]|uniref:Uncharacterized protein n=1 Tax=Armadillidium nasatum TaxID=96803 RepID=A0A5N5T1G3_9CRUS|nr:hypothetical protein Anas_13982 [Armadillidium nasatum]